MLNEAMICPQCGTKIDLQESGGLCLACLLNDALMGSVDEGAIGQLGGHELLELLACGGMGIVYRARKTDSDEEVALKALPRAGLLSEEAKQRFHTEAEAMSRLAHPTILPVKELGEEDGTPWFTMRLATGGSLAQRLNAYSGKWREIAELVASIAEAVQFAHERGVLHRDLKPGNILFDEGGRPMVSDFGLAKLLDQEMDLTRTIALMGTPNYMAPELTRGGKGSATTASDVWSLGIMLYELLAGQPPFHGDNLATVLRQLNEEEAPSLPREVPHDLSLIAGKALQKQPGRRYASAHDLAADLRLWLAGEAITARSQPVAERCWRWLRRHPFWAAAALLFLGGIVMLVLNERRLSHRNVELSRRLSDALVEQVRGRLQGEDLFTRHDEWMTQLLKAAALAPSIHVRDTTASVLSMPRVVQVERHRYRDLMPRGEAIAVSGDLKLRLTHRRVSSKSKDRVIELTALDAPVDDAPAVWRRHFPAHSAIFVDMNEDASRVVFTNGRISELWDTSGDQKIGEIDADSPTFPTLGKLWLVDLHLTQPLLAWIDREGALWAWRYPSGDRIRLGEPAKPVHGLVWSPKGDQIATSNPGGVELWQAVAPADPTSIAWAGASNALSWSPQGLVVGHFKLPEAAVIRRRQVACVLRTGEARLTRIDTFPGTWHALAVSADDKGWLWDMRDGRPLVRFSAGQVMLKAGTDGSRFVGSRVNNMMSLYEIPHEPVFREFHYSNEISEGAVSSIIRVSPDGRTVITVRKNGLLLWDRQQGRVVAEWPLEGSGKTSVVISPDGRFIFASMAKGPGLYRRSMIWKADVLELGQPELVPGTAGQFVWQIDRTGTRYLLEDSIGQSIWEGTDEGPVKEVSRLTDGQHQRRLSPSFTYGYAESVTYRELPLYAGLSDDVLKLVSPMGEWAGRALFSPDERWMLAHTRSYYRLFSVGDWREHLKIEYSVSGKSYGIRAFSPDARFAVIEQSSDLFGLITIPEGLRKVDLHAPEAGDIIGIAMADNHHLLLLNRHHRLFEWDLDALRSELVKMGLGW